MKGVLIDIINNSNSNKFPKVNGFKNLNNKSIESTNSLKKDMRRLTMIEPRNFIYLMIYKEILLRLKEALKNQ